MFKKLRPFEESERGSVTVLFGLSLPALLGFCALGTEVAYWQYNERTLQNAADAAAYSAAAQMAQGRDEDEIRAAAESAAVESGFDPAASDTPYISTPPAAGAFAGDDSAVEVEIVTHLPRMFTQVFFHEETITLRARSVARTAGQRPACVLALDPSASSAMTFQGSSDVVVAGCDLAANSISSNAMDFSGATNVVADCASAVGGITGEHNSLTLTDCARAYEGARLTPDPFRKRIMPQPNGCDSALESGFKGSGTLSPGTVCGDVTIHGDLTLEPGTYIFNGADVRVNAGTRLRGEGVTLVFLNGAEIDMNGGADVKITAPTDPADEMFGIVMFGDRDASGAEHVLNGNSATSFTGALYFPASRVEFEGTNVASPGACTLLIANTVKFTGNSYFGSDCTGLGLEAPETSQVVLIVE
ncbi:TadE/TadG family type IV pilus assembly protein [Parvularcula dongshanensis]|uniref:Putative Flp pilus-assembly TadG-like N-terminal domain-containing protein n=1 Tax=Parvularcula dongshanensis TaxID=1173995 RepID=A0A840I726_9PROT|nr:pilus assembly protein TadG-related protein [Parvularcula dongshanensis]MBB4660125.1 hypothetical protein [Parvularcula dongshanensis]